MRGMQQQLGHLETISEFFNSSHQKFQHLHGDTGNTRENLASITRKKRNSTSLSNGLRLSKKKNHCFLKVHRCHPSVFLVRATCK